MLSLVVLASAVMSQKLAPVPPLPSLRQLAWHQMRYYAFVHFGPNTFTNREWGEGKEDPNVFQPSALDCRQWVKTFKDAGMSGVILTVKHHDGFCLFPSKYSTHTVAQSSWRSGKGDVLRDLSEACKEFGLKLGVYLSPWDRNHPAYGTPEYNAIFVNTLTEVLTGYGPIFEVWFDGANGEGPNGKKQVYDWKLFVDTVRKHQPNAVIFSDAGPDVRWVGNEDGFANETNWALLDRDRFVPGTPLYRELTEGHENGSHWLPAECDVSIRPGWFYHADQDDRVKSLAHLLEIYYRSVGMGGNLLLNVPPDKRGLIHESDVERLKELRRVLDATFQTDLARGAKTSAREVIDDRPETYWVAPAGAVRGSFDVGLRGTLPFDRILLREPIALGQRVKSFDVQVKKGQGWETIVTGTTIGPSRILRVATTRAAAIRIRILDSRGRPAISQVSLYKAPSWAPKDPPRLAGVPPKPIEADAQGAYMLGAETANLSGGSIRFEEPRGCIGYWSDATSTASWVLSATKPRWYRVSAELACDPVDAGSTARIEIGGQALEFTVPPTKGWGDFTTVEVGEIPMVSPGRITVMVRCVKMAKGALMNLRRVVLRPRD